MYYQPLITIGIPIKNRAYVIRKVLKKIEELDYPKDRIEIIFVDDFSTDGTYEILCEWRERVKEKYYNITILRVKSNIPEARNIIVRYARGSYILFWDSDVIVPKNALKIALEMLKHNRNALVVASSSYVLVDPVTMKTWGRKYGVGFGFTLIDKKVFELVGLFNPFFYVGEEEILVRLTERTPYKVLGLPFPYIHLKRKPSLMSRVKNYFNGLKYYFEKYSEIYVKSFTELPLRYKLRLFYYVLFPWIMMQPVILSLNSSFQWLTLPSLTLLIIYIIAGLLINLRDLTKIGAPCLYAVKAYILHNVPHGIVFAYGTLIKMVTRIVKKTMESIKLR